MALRLTTRSREKPTSAGQSVSPRYSVVNFGGAALGWLRVTSSSLTGMMGGTGGARIVHVGMNCNYRKGEKVPTANIPWSSYRVLSPPTSTKYALSKISHVFQTYCTSAKSNHQARIESNRGSIDIKLDSTNPTTHSQRQC